MKITTLSDCFYDKSWNELSLREKKITIIIYLLFVTALGLVALAPSVSASTQTGEIPDFCYEYNDIYDIILDNYYNIDQFETITIVIKDVPTTYRIDLLAGYAILADLYGTTYDVSYYYKHYPTINDPTKDFLTFETYSTSEYLRIKLEFDSDDSLDQEFFVNITESCVEPAEPVSPPVQYNFTSSYFNDLIAWYTFDYPTDVDSYIHNVYEPNTLDLKNYAGDPDIVYNGGKHGNGYRIDGSASYSYTDYHQEQFFPNDEMTFCYWVNFTDTSSDRLIFYIKNKTGSGQDILNYYNDNTDWRFNFGGSSYYTTDSPSDWDFVCGRLSSSENVQFSINGANVSTSGSGVPDIDDFTDVILYLGGVPSAYYMHGSLDDFAIWNRSLTDAEIASLYNSSNGIIFNSSEILSAPSISAISDYYMAGDSSVDYDLDSYITGWEDIYIYYRDPVSLSYLKLYTGHETLNSDYFDLKLYANGTLTITSYERPYDFSLNVFGCVYSSYELCSNESFTIHISTDLGSVTKLNNMEAYYNLGYGTSYKLFSGNYFFQYYENIKFIFVDSNYTGVLNSTFPFSYSQIANPTLNGTFRIFMDCDISQDLTTYTFLGDLNITMECGSNAVYWEIYPRTNYNQKVSLYAWNSHSSAYANSTILAYNYNNPAWALYGTSGYSSSQGTSNISAVETNWYTFSNLLPDGLSDSNQNRLVFMILLVVNGVIFAGLFRKSVGVALVCCDLVTIFLLFLFANAGFINYFFPILLLFITLGYGLIKLVRGG